MSAALRDAYANVRARRARVALSATGIALAAAMLAVSATVAYGLLTGFARSASQADLPDVIVRFDAQPASSVRARVAALPDVAAFSLRQEITGMRIGAGSHEAANAVAEVIGPGRRGYAIVAGHDVSGSGVVIEQGLAAAWGLAVGDTLEFAAYGSQRIVGIAREPDDVAYPLAAPHVYLSLAEFTRPSSALPGEEAPGVAPGQTVNVAEIWLRNPADLDAVLVQARITSYGLRNLSIVTRSGVRVLIDQAAGIVVSLLAALSLVALLTATAMLTASARAEIQRRMRAIGIRRAIGASRMHVARVSALEALIVALPAAAVGVTAGALAAIGPSERLLVLLNEASPGAELALPLIACFALTATIPVLASAWPAWRAAGAQPVALLGGVELQPPARPSSGIGPSGLPGLGARLVTARRARLAATLVSLAACASFVLLMLALVGELNTLVNDPAAIGRRYQLTAALPASAAPQVRALPGVAAVAPRYEEDALDSFSLGENIDVIAFPGDHTIFEAPSLVAGRRLRGSGETEVGSGLAQVLGLGVGSTLALALRSGHELRLRVSGIVSALEHDGRVAYVPASALLGAEPEAPEQLAVRVVQGASAQAVAARLQALGSTATATKGVAGSGQTLVDALKALLIVVAVIDGLVCLYTLLQALLLLVNERRSAIAVLRACGAGARSVGALLAGSALAVLVPAAGVAIVLERVVLGPAIAHIAAGYAALALGADAAQILALLGGLALLAAGAVWWVAARVSTTPISGELA